MGKPRGARERAGPHKRHSAIARYQTLIVPIALPDKERAVARCD